MSRGARMHAPQAGAAVKAPRAAVPGHTVLSSRPGCARVCVCASSAAGQVSRTPGQRKACAAPPRCERAADYRCRWTLRRHLRTWRGSRCCSAPACGPDASGAAASLACSDASRAGDGQRWRSLLRKKRRASPTLGAAAHCVQALHLARPFSMLTTPAPAHHRSSSRCHGQPHNAMHCSFVPNFAASVLPAREHPTIPRRRIARGRAAGSRSHACAPSRSCPRNPCPIAYPSRPGTTGRPRPETHRQRCTMQRCALPHALAVCALRAPLTFLRRAACPAAAVGLRALTPLGSLCMHNAVWQRTGVRVELRHSASTVSRAPSHCKAQGSPACRA